MGVQATITISWRLVTLAVLLGSCTTNAKQSSESHVLEMSSEGKSSNAVHRARRKLIRRQALEADESSAAYLIAELDERLREAGLEGSPEGKQTITELETKVRAVGPRGEEALMYTADMCVPEIQKIDEIARDPRNKVVCEIGFNVGHTSVYWLVNSQAHVYSFDIGNRPDIQTVAANFVQEAFPGRFTITWGDSLKSIPDFIRKNPDVKCNLLFVDGGHEFNVISGDIANFAKMANSTYNIVMADDVTCDADYCVDPTKVWDSWVSSGKIRETFRRDEKSCGKYGQSRGWTVGHYVL